ncbi:unnamed protein product [Kluyveromyces dobzhanskii CBS 2104]|uniref:WGS project CCBQ000000000 data, contig 00015 n=1 Tax=Kluyveromyces dobzhanskii CBS 2104 TaxID=1427455 RepID=A0A0A8L8M0_9SACH|nr:unnamed protein product [Kluyveromyces dobzhanskii CBS 2104]
MAQIYNYQESFWDEDDQGVTILLQHVGRGICTCELLLDSFTRRSELELDYARRLGAISSKIVSNLERYADYNSMSESLKYFQSSQQRVANGHSKAYERLNRENVGTMGDFLKQYRARWSTLTSNVENLRKLKDEKKKALKALDQELLGAENKLRENRLNRETALGEYQRKENIKELEKWSSIVEESHRRKTVLHHEYKAARTHWFEEWRHISGELQDLETQRIQVSRELLQQYAEFTTQPSELELSLMEQLKQKLSSFTPELEISHFSYHHGTGRIKQKSSNSVSHNNSSTKSNPSSSTRPKPLKSVDLTKNDRYVQNVKRLSTQLKNTRLNSINALSVNKELPTPKNDATVENHAVLKVVDAGSALNPAENYSEVANKDNRPTTLSESSEETCSNPTDFTHRKNKSSYDSMSTSLSSMASSVDDSQRYAKSWNSRNRRKSRPSSMYSSTADIDTSTNSKSHHLEVPFANRRKSIASDVEGALKILEKNDSRPMTSRTSSLASSNLTVSRTALPLNSSLNITRCKRVTVDGEQLNLPIIDSMKNPVIRYAKATFSYTEPNDNNILLFNTEDILLLVECINEDWYVGEVYQGNKQHGLVPMNYVRLIN